MNSIEFARNLFLLRREHRMTIEDLASAMEVSVELVCQWECAKTSPTLDQMNRLAKVYGIPLAEVIRSPKPADTVPAPAPIPEEFAEAQKRTAEKNPAEAISAEIEDTAEVEDLTEGEAAKKSSESKKKRAAWWEIFVIVLLLVIITVAVIFLIKPEWFPLQNVLAVGSALRIPKIL